MATDLYFMGVDDNSKFKSKLLNYLQIIYNQPTPDNNWINNNYTLMVDSYVTLINNISSTAKVVQTMTPNKNTCVRFNYCIFFFF